MRRNNTQHDSWLPVDEGAGVSTRGRFDLGLVTCCLEREEGRVVLKWRDGGRLEEIARALSWPVRIGHRTPAL